MRVERGLSQAQLARKSCLSEKTIQRAERGAVLRSLSMARITRALELPGAAVEDAIAEERLRRRPELRRRLERMRRARHAADFDG